MWWSRAMTVADVFLSVRSQTEVEGGSFSEVCASQHGARADVVCRLAGMRYHVPRTPRPTGD